MTLLGSGFVVLADSPATPVPWVAASSDGSCLFKMVPAKWRRQGEERVLEREAFGVANCSACGMATIFPRAGGCERPPDSL